jgi:hypothetical protein
MLAKIGSREERNRKADYTRHSIEGAHMRPRRGEGVQGGETNRTSSVLNAQIASNTTDELADTVLERKRAAQKEQVSRLHRLNVSPKGRRRTRQVESKVSQAFFGSCDRCLRRHDQF